jgi:hypothetical protein
MILARILDLRLDWLAWSHHWDAEPFRDFGLSTATVQRDTITDELDFDIILINLSVAYSWRYFRPLRRLWRLYHEPRLFAVTAVLATGLFFNAAGVQHPHLQRQMRFTALSLIDII